VTRLPADFEAEERTTAYESLSILQVVSGRQLLGEIKEVLPNLGQRYREHQASSWETLLLTSGLLEDIEKDISDASSTTSATSASNSMLNDVNTSWEEVLKEIEESDSKPNTR